MTPEESNHAEAFDKMMAAEKEAVSELRAKARAAAREELSDTFLHEIEEDYDHTPPHFDDMVKCAANLIYQAGSPLEDEDKIVEAMKHDFERKSHDPDSKDWVPELADMQMLTDVIRMGSILARMDDEPAFNPSVYGRDFEALAPEGTVYNKYGLRVDQYGLQVDQPEPTASQS